ncbi:MAG TPA: diguanylate cyclase [Kofleriaceae bacterium]|nr:diguanylate cyclase [Kofleriaceae bacterium]
MKRALILDEDVTTAAEVRSALADVGCVDIEAMSMDEALARLGATNHVPDIALVHLAGSDLHRLHRLSLMRRELPIVVICEDRLIDAVHIAGAAECVTLPVRPRELLGRIRCALRDRHEARHQASRERKMSEKIVSLEQEKQDLERLVCVDALTGVANRRHTLSLLEAEWKRSSREALPLGVVMLDLDCYHQYNEQYGHLGGDVCLQRVADAMVRCLRRPADFLGRYGGEEFLAVMPNTDAVGAKIVAERLRSAVEALGIPHIASVCSRVVTVTAGFASLHVAPDLTMDKLVAVADAALLRAKSKGRNRIEGDAPLVRPMRVSAQRWQRFAPVFADPWYADQIPVFLAEAHAGAKIIAQALRNAEPWRIESTAMALRTRAGELGLMTLEQLVMTLERHASAADHAATREAADEVIEYVTHVQVVYRRVSEPSNAVLAALSS